MPSSAALPYAMLIPISPLTLSPSSASSLPTEHRAEFPLQSQPTPSSSDHYLREADDRGRRLADIADRGPWTSQMGGKPAHRVSLERTGVRAKAAFHYESEMSFTAPGRLYAKRSIRDCASAISGISGVGEKPSSAGASTAWASTRRSVD
jgi:hypothetical protein